jgi:hypothetical protein
LGFPRVFIACRISAGLTAEKKARKTRWDLERDNKGT